MRNGKPIILITAAREPDVTNHNIDMLRLHKNYADSIAAAGGLPLIPALCGECADVLSDMADALLLSGGRDIEPELMGCARESGCGEVDTWRDSMEWSLLREFVLRKKPVFGICRGLQFINAFFGGTLFQDLPSRFGICHSETVHHVVAEQSSFLEELFSHEFVVNSFHHQSVDSVGEGLVITARDGVVVEGLRHSELPISAVQWHPERMVGDDRFNKEGPDMLPLFSWWIGQASM